MLDDLDELERQLGDRLRRTLAVVSGHGLSDPVAAAVQGPTPRVDRGSRRSKRTRRILVIAAALAALATLAWNNLDHGEIVRIPVEEALMHGEAEDGGRWWLIPSQAIHEPLASIPSTCVAVVEFVSAAANQPGAEWSTGGVAYGEPTGGNTPGCYEDTAWLADPYKLNMGSARLGDHDDPDTAWGFFAAVHPTVSRAEVYADGEFVHVAATTALPDRPDGPRFTAFTVPKDASTVRVEFLDDQDNLVRSVSKTIRSN